MPAKDIYHDRVRHALEKDGWVISHDPLMLRYGKKDLFVDLGAEKFIAAQKGEHKIAVEIKSFLGQSEVADLRDALGQYILYQNVLTVKEPDRKLFLAIPDRVFIDIFEEDLGQLVITQNQLKILVFNLETEEIIQWIV